MKERAYKVRVADKSTGDEHIYEIKASSQAHAESQIAASDNWLVIPTVESYDDSEPVSSSSPSKSKPSPTAITHDGKIRLWSPDDPIERAVVRGIVKAYVLIVLCSLLIGMVMILLYAISGP